MHISSALLLALLVGAGVANSVPADDSDLGFYFDDAPLEPVLTKRQRPSGGNFRGGPPSGVRGPPSRRPPFPMPFMHQVANGGSGGSQTQAVAPVATNTGGQGGQPGSRSVNSTAPITNAAAEGTGRPVVPVTTVHTTVLSGTITKTLMPKSASGAQPSGKGNVPQSTKLHPRHIGMGMGMAWWQHRGFQWYSHANDRSSLPSVPQQGFRGGSKKTQQGQGQGSGSRPGGQSASQGQAPPQGQSQLPQANTPQSSQAPAPAPSSNSGSSDGSSGGVSGYMSVVSKWRTAMGKSALSQDSTLEQNALKTANDGNGQMVHELNPGSFGQVLAPGNAGNFESVFVGGWLCENHNLPGLNGICATMEKGWDHSNGETGHADILSSTSYKKIGCALAKGIWACDLA